MMFTITLSLLCLMILMLQSSYIQTQVDTNSRCVRERKISNMGGVFSVSAFNDKNEELYKISYDMNNNGKYNVSCACKKGDIRNNFSNIKYYNLLNKNTITGQSIPCYCDKSYLPARISWRGHPDLERYMYDNDVSFFNKFSAS